MATALLDGDATTARASLCIGGGTLDDNGTVTIDDNLSNVEVGGSFYLDSTGTLDSTYYENTALTVDSGGYAELDGTWIGDYGMIGNDYGGAIENDGTVQIDGSDLSGLGQITNAGTVCFAYNGTVDLSGQTLSGGTWEISGSTTATVNSNLTLDSVSLLVGDGGTLTVPSGVSLDQAGNSIEVANGGTINVAGTLDTDRGTLTVDYGGTANVAGMLNDEGNCVEIDGNLNVASNACLNVESTGYLFVGAAGTATVNGSLLNGSGGNIGIAGTLYLGSGGILGNGGYLSVDAGATAQIDGTAYDDYGGAGYIEIAGSVNVGHDGTLDIAPSGDDGTLTIDGGTGLVEVDGTLDIDNNVGYGGFLVADGTLTNESDGLINISGNLGDFGTFEDNGEVDYGGSGAASYDVPLRTGELVSMTVTDEESGATATVGQGQPPPILDTTGDSSGNEDLSLQVNASSYTNLYYQIVDSSGNLVESGAVTSGESFAIPAFTAADDTVEVGYEPDGGSYDMAAGRADGTFATPDDGPPATEPAPMSPGELKAPTRPAAAAPTITNMTVDLSTAPAGDPNTLIGYNGYNFYDVVVVTGTHVGDIVLHQQLMTSTREWSYSGQQFTSAQVMALAKAWANQNGANFNPNVISTDQQWVQDKNWGAKTLDLVAGNTAYWADEQSETVPTVTVNGTTHYCPLLDIWREFKITATDATGNPVLINGKADFVWGYGWTNDNLKWRGTDPTPPPSGVSVCARGNNANGTGTYGGIDYADNIFANNQGNFVPLATNNIISEMQKESTGGSP